MVRDKALETTNRILDSQLAPAQKAQLYDLTVAPAVTYVLGTLYAEKSRATALKKCRDLDGDIRKLFVEKGLWSKTTSRAGLYLPTTKGTGPPRDGGDEDQVRETGEERLAEPADGRGVRAPEVWGRRATTRWERRSGSEQPLQEDSPAGPEEAG